jgi:flagellar M-ring protein FliF
VGHLNESSRIKNEAINERNVERESRHWKMNKISVGVAIDGVWKKKYSEKTGELLFNPDGSIEREYIPVSDQELKTVADLIKGAVGYDQTRGDDVTVKHLQKDRRLELRAEDDKYRQIKEIRSLVFWIAVGIGIILLIIVFSRMLSKYIEKKRQEREEELARQHQAMREAALRTAEEQGMDVELSIEERARLEMQENAINMAREHPEDVAQLIRTWLLEE